MKQIAKILILIVVVFVVLSAVKNTIAQTLISGAISNAAHVPVQIGSTNVRLLSASIDIKKLRVYNPSGFSDKLMMDMPQIFIDFDPSALFKGQAHFKEVKLDLKEMTVVRNKDGKMNVDSVKPTSQEKQQSRQEAKPSGGQKAPKLMIDKLSISIGQVKLLPGPLYPAWQTSMSMLSKRVEYRRYPRAWGWLGTERKLFKIKLNSF